MSAMFQTFNILFVFLINYLIVMYCILYSIHSISRQYCIVGDRLGLDQYCFVWLHQKIFVQLKLLTNNNSV